MTGSTIFREVQRWRNVWWMMVLVMGLAALQWWTFFVQIVRGVPVGNNPGSDMLVVIIWLGFGIGFPAFFLWLHMVVEVAPGAITIGYRPFANRRISTEEIIHVESCTYQPIREFAGWGIRGWGGRIAYNVSGNIGVELTLADGRRVLIGSQRADELAVAIDVMLSDPG